MKTVSLELAKQLKEAGHPQESVMWWQLELDLKHGHLEDYESTDTHEIENIASPTADEILDQLPSEVPGGWFGAFICVEKYKEDNSYDVGYRDKGDFRPFYPLFFKSESLADAAAQMWLYLKKEGLL